MSALAGVRILELAEDVAGEYCGKLLADFGAEVLKLEKPGGGSPTRQRGPFAPGGGTGENSGLFAYLNTNKRSCTLELAQPVAQAALHRLLERVDVVIDDHPSGWLAGIGLDAEAYQQRWPRLTVCSITAFGQAPPDDRLHAEDLTVFHASGWGYHTPSQPDERLAPLKGPGRFLPSYEAALDAALCVVSALYERDSSGQGRFIDVSKQQVLASRIDYVLGQMVAGDMDVGTRRTAFDLFGPASIFACRDGFAYIWMSAPAHWDALGKLLGQPEWMRTFPERWLERECTPERVAQVRHHIGAWLKTQNKHEAAEKAQELGLTLVAVNNAGDLEASPQYQYRGFFAAVNHPSQGPARYPTVPYKLSLTPAALRTPAPLLGEPLNEPALWEQRP